MIRLTPALLLVACKPTVLIGGTVADVITEEPVADIQFCVEQPEDAGCVTTDDDGHAEMELEANLDEIIVGIRGPGYVDTLSYGFTTENDNTDILLQIVSDGALDLIEIATGMQVDDTKGQVVIFADDAGDTSPDGATGIVPSLEPASGTLFYITQDPPDVDTEATGTTITGLAGFMNVDVGDATLVIDGDCEGRWTYASFDGSQPIEVRAGIMTYVEVECVPE